MPSSKPIPKPTPAPTSTSTSTSTTATSTTAKRCYRQFCGLARALDLVGERWTLLIVRDLLLGPWRYSDLLARLPGLTTNLLARRLKDMEAHGLVEKRRLPPPASSDVYALTELGQSLEPVVMELGRFGQHLMAAGPRPDDRIDPGWALLSMKRRYVGSGEASLTFQISSPAGNSTEPEVYQIHAQPNYVDVRAGSPHAPETTVHLGRPALKKLLFGEASPGELESTGEIRIEGEPGPWQAFQRAFGFADQGDG